MKRLRKRVAPRLLRFFHCGEYGELNSRPHYHACLFNWDFPDRVLFRERDGVRLYTSAMLSEVWPFGFSTVGDVTFESAAYVARYIMKKITGSRAEEAYKRVDAETGELIQVSPEYTTMSRRPGIGAGWFERFSSDAYPSDFVTVRGVRQRPPRFYDSLYERAHADELERIKALRVKGARTHKGDLTYERLKVRERVKRAQIGLLKREVE